MAQKCAPRVPICILNISSFNVRFVVELQFGDSKLFCGVKSVFFRLDLEYLILIHRWQLHIILEILSLLLSESLIRRFILVLRFVIFIALVDNSDHEIQ